MREKKYKGYRAIDFLKDENFLRWNLFKDKDDNTYWENVMAKNPELNSAIEKAVYLYSTQIRLNDYSLAPEVIETQYNILYQRAYRQKKRRNLYIWLSAAASLLLLFAVTRIYQYSQDLDSGLLEFVEVNPISADLSSGDIQLFVSSGKMIRIDVKEPAISYNPDSISVTGKTVAELNKSDFSQLIVPKGKRSKLTLSDGTALHVNSSTKVVYPNQFSGNIREIYVNGEVFLDVGS